VASQRWRWVSFVHWRVPSEAVAPLLPAGTRPDEIDGTSWVGLIAFHISEFTFRPGIRLAYAGRFPEINVRLYTIDAAGRRGVVFLSMEASRLLAVLGARVSLQLPYVWASMRVRVDEMVEYSSRRLGPRHPHTHLSVRPLPERVVDDPIADFLTARWGLHGRSWGRTRFVRNEHEPWPLQRAELVSLDDHLIAAAGLPGIADRAPDSVLYASGVTARFARPSPTASRTGMTTSKPVHSATRPIPGTDHAGSRATLEP
jgi:uncharacterized protein YqjF (DUF2071 family)